MKKIVSSILAIVSVLSIMLLVACGKADKIESDTEALPTDEQTYTDLSEETDESQETAPVAIIDLESLKAIESKDSFDVKVSKKEIIKDAYKGLSLEGNDGCMITITNNTSEDISEVSIYTVAYNEKNGLKKLSQGVYTVGGEPYIQLFTTQDTVIPAGQSETLGIKCRAEEIAGVRAIVASYKTSDGTLYENSAAEEWYKNTQVGKSTVLD